MYELRPEIVDRAGQGSLVERFGIVGLHGYRNISIASEYAASILIAKNGTGKTTLLGALDAFLRLQFNRLRNLEFQEIRCKMRGIESDLVITQADVIEYLTPPNDGELVKLAARSGVDVSDLFNFVIGEIDLEASLNREVYDHPVFSKLSVTFRYDSRDTLKALNALRDEQLAKQPNIAGVASHLRSCLQNYEIVYLPTYRRVELALTDEERTRAHGKRYKPKFTVASGSLFTGDIQFGLSDISERLSELNHKIILESNSGYREISANIINDLIDGSYQRAGEISESGPSETDLRLFFSRLREGRRMGPFAPVVEPNLEKLYSDSDEDVPEASRTFLSYFLGKLKTVIDATQKIERPVQEFIDNCNKYLNSREPSTHLHSFPNEREHQMSEGKRLALNKQNLRVHVESLPEERRIPLDSLSSGEKQMISLFAKLFLYDKKKLVLIDEPELSLSIDWQRSILVDVLNSPLCEQLIAITHSPFVFDNELEPFARTLSSSRSPLNVHPNDFSYEDDDGQDLGD